MEIETFSNFASHSLIYFADGRLLGAGSPLPSFNTKQSVTKPNKVLEHNLLTQDENFSQISSGYSHFTFLKSNGELWLHEDSGNVKEPTLIIKDENIFKILSGLDFTVIWKKNGEIWTFGKNDRGQLGNGDLSNQNFSQPVLVMTEKEILSIAVGCRHVLVLKKNGELWGWGQNSSGQLGIGNTVDKRKPELLRTDKSLTNVCCGGYFSYFFKNNGEVWVCGDNQYGQLGIGNNQEQHSPVKMTQNNTIQGISCGGYHVYLLKKNGEVMSCGFNFSGQLGIGNTGHQNKFVLVTKDEKILAVRTGWCFSMFVKSDGELYVVGHNTNAQLGTGTTSDEHKPRLLWKDDRILILLGGARVLSEWSPETNKRFSQLFQERVRTFVLVLKRKNKETGLRVPKPLFKMIINFSLKY